MRAILLAFLLIGCAEVPRELQAEARLACKDAPNPHAFSQCVQDYIWRHQ